LQVQVLSSLPGVRAVRIFLSAVSKPEHFVAHENAPNKPVHLVFLCGGLLLFYLLKWTTDWIWGYFTRAPSELYITVGAAAVALLTGIILYRNERTYTLVNEVTAELKKVSWPTGKEVRAATIVVIVMTIISALILGFFDFIWSNVTEFIYG
jgi:preprotein translocase SecE subunit